AHKGRHGGHAGSACWAPTPSDHTPRPIHTETYLARQYFHRKLAILATFDLFLCRITFAVNSSSSQDYNVFSYEQSSLSILHDVRADEPCCRMYPTKSFR